MGLKTNPEPLVLDSSNLHNAEGFEGMFHDLSVVQPNLSALQMKELYMENPQIRSLINRKAEIISYDM
ncbi:hypothetical protein ACI2KR_07800 [Pseudomonas luteola]